MKLIWRLSLLVAALIPVFSLSENMAAAHVYETNNGISAILHIKPDDRPISATPTVINFLFNDEAGGFNLNDYQVTLTLLAEGEMVLQQKLEPAFFGAAAEGETTVTFPKPAVYDFRLTGKPASADAPPFTLNYTARVTDGSPTAVKTFDGITVVMLSIFSLVLLAMLAGRAIYTGGRYNSPKLK